MRQAITGRDTQEVLGTQDKWSPRNQILPEQQQNNSSAIKTYLSGFMADNTKMRIITSRLLSGNGTVDRGSDISHTNT